MASVTEKAQDHEGLGERRPGRRHQGWEGYRRPERMARDHEAYHHIRRAVLQGEKARVSTRTNAAPFPAWTVVQLSAWDMPWKNGRWGRAGLRYRRSGSGAWA